MARATAHTSLRDVFIATVDVSKRIDRRECKKLCDLFNQITTLPSLIFRAQFRLYPVMYVHVLFRVGGAPE
jgi:hypothetical protein